MIFNSQGAAELKQFINGGSITPGAEAIVLPKGAELLGDLTIEAADTTAAYEEGYNAGYEEGKASETLPYLKELEYIQSNGTEYIDTGVKPNQNTRTVMDFEPTEAYSSVKAYFGARDTNTSTAPNQYALWNNGAKTLRSDYFYTNVTLTITNLLSRKIVDKNKNVTSVDGVSVTNTANSGQCISNLTLFAINISGTVSYNSKMRLYSCKIYDNGALVRNFIPVLDNNGIACLYDKVGKQLYYNRGSGSFSYA